MKRCIAVLLSILLLSACDTGGQSPAAGSGIGSSDPSGPAPAASPSEPTPAADPSEPDPAASRSETDPSPDSAPEPRRNEIVEALLREYDNPNPNLATLAEAKPDGLDLYFSDGTTAHLPIPSTGPGVPQNHAASLRNDAVVIAYDPEDGSDTVTVISTVDRGQRWRTASLDVGEIEKYGYYFLAFQDGEKGILALCERDRDGGPIFSTQDTSLIFATEDAGATWGAPDFLPVMEDIWGVTGAQGCYCISGRMGSRPVVLKSGDGRSWDTISLPFDASKYTTAYCQYTMFSGDIGLAKVTATKTTGDNDFLNFFSEDGGQSWSLYE